jgi:hypothetical protein
MLAWLIGIVVVLIIGLVVSLILMRRANRPKAIAEHTDAYWHRARGGRA